MRIWWCQEHEASGYNDDTSGKCWLDDLGGGDPHDYKPCRMVPMRLIPDNTETLHDRIKNVEVLVYDGQGYSGASAAQVISPDELVRILAALDGETP